MLRPPPHPPAPPPRRRGGPHSPPPPASSPGPNPKERGAWIVPLEEAVGAGHQNRPTSSGSRLPDRQVRIDLGEDRIDAPEPAGTRHDENEHRGGQGPGKALRGNAGD